MYKHLCRIAAQFPGAVTALGLVACSLVPQTGQGAVSGRIVVAGDEWAFSDPGLDIGATYAGNVVNWFGLTPGSGKRVLLLDGQSWNPAFNGTYGAFGNHFQSLLSSAGLPVTYQPFDSAPVSLSGYDAVFVDGAMISYTSLTSDLASFVHGGGAVYVAGGTSDFGDGSAAAEAAYWQPFFTAATGSSDFGLGTHDWFNIQGSLSTSGPVGAGVSALSWTWGQDVRVGSNPAAGVAVMDSSHTLVGTFSAVPESGTCLAGCGALAMAALLIWKGRR